MNFNINKIVLINWKFDRIQFVFESWKVCLFGNLSIRRWRLNSMKADERSSMQWLKQFSAVCSPENESLWAWKGYYVKELEMCKARIITRSVFRFWIINWEGLEYIESTSKIILTSKKLNESIISFIKQNFRFNFLWFLILVEEPSTNSLENKILCFCCLEKVIWSRSNRVTKEALKTLFMSSNWISGFTLFFRIWFNTFG